MQLFVFANCVRQHVSHTFLGYQSLAGPAKTWGLAGTCMMDGPALLFVPSSTGSCAVTFHPVCQTFYVISTPPPPPQAWDQNTPLLLCCAAAVRGTNSLINYEKHLNNCAFLSG